MNIKQKEAGIGPFFKKRKLDKRRDLLRLRLTNRERNWKTLRGSRRETESYIGRYPNR